MTAGEIHYSDLFFLTLLPIIIQGVAIVYLWKIHRLIGREMTWMLGGINGILLWYDLTISYLLFTSGNRPGQQTIEAWGLFIGFAMPLANATLHLILQRRLAKSLGMVATGGGGR